MQMILNELHEYIDTIIRENQFMIYDYDLYTEIKSVEDKLLLKKNNNFEKFYNYNIIKFHILQLADIMDKIAIKHGNRCRSIAASVEFYINNLILNKKFTSQNQNHNFEPRNKTDTSININNMIVCNYIAITKQKELARQLKQKIAVPVERSDIDCVSWFLQRHSLMPRSNFIKMTPPKYATIIRLESSYYFTSFVLFKSEPAQLGIHPNYPVVRPVKITPRVLKSKKDWLELRNNEIYETLDDIHYRRLYTTKFRKLGTISGIAQGYQNQLNSAINNAAVINLEEKINYNHLSKAIYSSIFRTIDYKNIKDKNFPQFYNAYVEYVEPDMSNLAEKMEFKIGVRLEFMKLISRAFNAKTQEDFVNELINDQKSFIISFLRKKSIIKNTN